MLICRPHSIAKLSWGQSLWGQKSLRNHPIIPVPSGAKSLIAWPNRRLRRCSRKLNYVCLAEYLIPFAKFLRRVGLLPGLSLHRPDGPLLCVLPPTTAKFFFALPKPLQFILYSACAVVISFSASAKGCKFASSLRCTTDLMTLAWPTG